MDWNLKELEKIWKKLKVQKKYQHMVIDFETLLNHDINMCLSITDNNFMIVTSISFHAGKL